MSPEQKRKFNTIAGTFFSLGSTIFLVLTAYLVIVPAPIKPVPIKNVLTVSKESCSDYLRSMDFEVDGSNNKDLKVKGELRKDLDLEASKYYLDRISLATSMCRYPLKEFCAGIGCGGDAPAVVFDLTIPPDAVEVKAPATVSAGGN